VTARVSDLAAAPAPIRFGTSGWRGVLADEITGPRMRRLAAAVARWAAASHRHPRILVAHDTRFLGAHLARLAVESLAASGARPVWAASPVPTPVVAHAVREGRADAALIVTASHNEPAYQGVKVLAGWGGGVTLEQARRIEDLAASEHRETPRAAAQIPALDLVEPYLERLLACIDCEAVRRARLRLIYDAFHGTGSGVCDRALRAAGVRVDVLHASHSPHFGGAAPDPTPPRLAELAEIVGARGGRTIGVATDGDADRYAVLDSDGVPIAESDALALLVDHLARSGRARRGVAISIATGTLVERVAAEHGLPVSRHPIGFKHLSRALVEGTADVAGEESGGFAWEPLARDKDGILACVLFAEIAATSGTTLRARLRQLLRRHGRRVCGRLARIASERSRARLAALSKAPPERVGTARVRDVDGRDGLRLEFDDGFLMLRASGTEPVLRVYAEARERRALAARFAAGWRLLGEDVGAACMDAARGAG
jgi:phosphoglucomutase